MSGRYVAEWKPIIFGLDWVGLAWLASGLYGVFGVLTLIYGGIAGYTIDDTSVSVGLNEGLKGVFYAGLIGLSVSYLKDFYIRTFSTIFIILTLIGFMSFSWWSESSAGTQHRVKQNFSGLQKSCAALDPSKAKQAHVQRCQQAGFSMDTGVKHVAPPVSRQQPVQRAQAPQSQSNDGFKAGLKTNQKRWCRAVKNSTNPKGIGWSNNKEYRWNPRKWSQCFTSAYPY